MKKVLAKIIPESLKNLIRRILFGKQVEETTLILKLFKGIKKPATMIDVGAHYGYSMLPFAKEGWDILAFEPDKKNRSILQETITEHSLSNIKVDIRALSDKPGQLKFYTSDVSSGISSLAPFHDSHRVMDTVEVTTLNQVCDQYNLSEIQFLKIDTEGYDLFVLKGLNFKKIVPQAIVCEFENNKTKKLGYTVDDQIRFLKEQGYQVIISEWHPIVEYGRRHKWRQYTLTGDSLPANAWGNLIAVPEKYFSELKEICRISS